MEIGLALVRQKAALGHGHFLRWLQAEFQMTPRTASTFARVAEVYGAKSETLSVLPVTVVYELAAPSTAPDISAEVERRVASGELVRVADVKALKAQVAAADARAVAETARADAADARAAAALERIQGEVRVAQAEAAAQEPTADLAAVASNVVSLAVRRGVFMAPEPVDDGWRHHQSRRSGEQGQHTRPPLSPGLFLAGEASSPKQA